MVLIVPKTRQYLLVRGMVKTIPYIGNVVNLRKERFFHD